MNAICMDGNSLASSIRKEIAEEISKSNQKPYLTIIWVGDNPESARYIKWKQIDAQECGINYEIDHLPEDSEEDQIIDLITLQNIYHGTHGIMVQLPLPKHLNQERILNAIDPRKDVDGLTNYNAGLLMRGVPEAIAPCTPLGIMRLLETYDFVKDLPSMQTLIIGRSNLVGKPLFHLLLQKNANVRIVHSKTSEDLLKHEVRTSDLIISAAGCPGLITPDMTSSNQIIVDVGTTMGEDGKLHGDVDPKCLRQSSLRAWTPVPGGVGPMTRVMIMQNVLDAYKKQIK